MDMGLLPGRSVVATVLSPTSMDVELLPGRLVVAMGAPLSSGMSIDVPLAAEPRYHDAPLSA